MFIMSNRDGVGQHVANINQAVSKMTTSMDAITKTVTNPDLMAAGINSEAMLMNADQLAKAVNTLTVTYTALGQAHQAAAEDMQLLDATLARGAGAGTASA